jgi:DNA-binding SARP family transcriptional activator
LGRETRVNDPRQQAKTAAESAGGRLAHPGMLGKAAAFAEAGNIAGAERVLGQMREEAARSDDEGLVATANLGLQLCRLINQFDEASAELDRAYNQMAAMRTAEREALSRSLASMLTSSAPLSLGAARIAAAVLHNRSTLPFALGIVEVRAPAEVRLKRRELRVRLLGGFEVSLDGRPIGDWRSARARHVFAYLVLNWRQPVSRHQLMGLFWPEHSEDRAENNLSLAIMAARRILGAQSPGAHDLIRAGGGAYGLGAVDVRLDVDEFQELLDRAGELESAGRDLEACEALDGAIEVYAGEFLPSGLYEDWTVERRQHLHDSFAEALARRARLARRLGDYRGAIDANRRLVDCDPANEEAHCELMLDYLKTGQRSRALRQAQLCADALDRHVGVSPGRRTVAVIRLVQQQSI